MGKIIITKKELLNHTCIVNGYFKFENKYWIEYKAWSYKLDFIPLN